MKLIYSILRFAKRREYLEEMQRGHLRLNTLGFYLEYEGHGEKARADKDEGLTAVYQPSKVRVFIGKDKCQHEIMGICSPIKIRVNRIAADHILCMYAMHPGRWADDPIESVEEFIKYLEIKEENKEFGEYVLCTLNTQEFLNRIVTSLRSQGISFTMGPVEYIDADTYHGSIPKERIGFVKCDKFSYQNEYRLYIPNQTGDSGVKYYDVGDLSDITFISTFDELKQNIKIGFPDE
jgi:hypothetical protein